MWPPGLFGWMMTRRLDDPQPLVSFVRSHAHAQLIFELHKAAPSLLLCTLPDIAERLREDDLDRRKVRRCRQAVLSEYAKNMHRHHCSALLLTTREPRREPPPPHRDARRHRSREPRRS